MKRIAVSLGSLSLVLMQNGQCEPADPVEAFPTNISDVISEEAEQQVDTETLSLLESNTEELEDELLSLEQELDEEQQALALDENTLAPVEQRQEANQEVEAQAELAVVEQAAPAAAVEETNSLHLDTLTDSPQQNDAPLSSTQPQEQSPAAVQEIAQADAKTNDLIAISDMNEDFVSEPMQEAISEEIKTEEISAAPEETAAIPSAAQVIKAPAKSIEISLGQVFSGSPTIYLILLFLSVVSVVLWLFNLVSLKKYATASDALIKNIRNKLVANHYDEVLSLCKESNSFFCKMLQSGVSARKYGLQFMLESMKSEGKRASVSFWQRLNLLQDIAIIAPMLGLLGTVLGMFYAFYDLNRSFESISSLFDGLGISVGTTVAGIFVAILAMVLHSISKYRLVKSLSFVENEAVTLAHLIDSKQSH